MPIWLTVHLSALTYFSDCNFLDFLNYISIDIFEFRQVRVFVYSNFVPLTPWKVSAILVINNR